MAFWPHAFFTSAGAEAGTFSSRSYCPMVSSWKYTLGRRIQVRPQKGIFWGFVAARNQTSLLCLHIPYYSHYTGWAILVSRLRWGILLLQLDSVTSDVIRLPHADEEWNEHTMMRFFDCMCYLRQNSVFGWRWEIADFHSGQLNYFVFWVITRREVVLKQAFRGYLSVPSSRITLLVLGQLDSLRWDRQVVQNVGFKPPHAS